MSRVDEIYHQLSLNILETGYEYIDKTRDQVCTQISSVALDFNVMTDFPVLTTKKIHTKSIVTELLWFLRGDSNIKYLNDNGVTIWNKDAYKYYLKKYVGEPGNELTFEQYVEDAGSISGVIRNFTLGDIGRNYGVQWRDWKSKTEYINDNGTIRYKGVDQIGNLIKNLVEKPMSRRHIVTAWNPAELDETALPPCHWAFEIIPRPAYGFEKDIFPDVDYYFTLKWHQRSVDTFLGLPFNITSYAILAKIIEELTGYKAAGIVADLSNVHFYEGHIDKVKKQLGNDPRTYKSPKFRFSERASVRFEHFREGYATLDEIINELVPEDFIFENYESYPAIKADMYEPN